MRAFALIAACLLSSALAQEPENLARATQPLREGVPQVAVVRLRALLAGKLPEDERRAGLVRLGEALLGAGQPEEALRTLSNAAVEESADTRFLRAQALAALGRWIEALPLYEQSETAEARMGEAEALRALGRTDEALQAVGRLTSDRRWGVRARFLTAELLLSKLDVAGARRVFDSIQPTSLSERKERRLLRGRIEWQANRSERAVEMFASILRNPQGATHPVLMSTVSAIADAHLQLGTPEAGDDYLEDYIERHPGDPGLPLLFAKLDQLYAAQRRQSRHDLGRWSRDPAEPRRAFALWYLARAELRLERPDAARNVFEQLRANHPPLPALAEAFLQSAQLELQHGSAANVPQIVETARALQPPPELVERLNFLAARAQYDARQFADAARSFRTIANTTSTHANDALFNASLAWLSAADPGQASAAARELDARRADPGTRDDLALEQALLASARGEKEAAAALQKFVREHPKHARVSEAWVALAELAFHSTPPRLDEARQSLARVSETQPTPVASERADYLLIWLEEAAPAPNEERVIARATEFLQKHAGSALLPEVRLKLAETYFRRQDFASAQTQFELLAQQNPNSPLTEKALFFAGESAMQTMGKAALDRALTLFDQVVKRNGELKWAARNEQAVIERKLGKPDDAMTLYDEILKGDAKPAEKREALCAKGDILYELGAANPENYRRAIEIYTQLANDREASPHWRNQATFKKGMCLEKLNAPADALAAFYSVIEEESRPDARREFFWFYKAGFNAARLLEEQSQWPAAAAIYEKLTFAGGARSEEAKVRLNRLRLEHFLWEQ